MFLKLKFGISSIGKNHKSFTPDINTEHDTKLILHQKAAPVSNTTLF